MGEMAWFWEDYAERNDDPSPPSPKNVMPSRCAICLEPLSPKEHKSNTKCDACFALTNSWEECDKKP